MKIELNSLRISLDGDKETSTVTLQLDAIESVRTGRAVVQLWDNKTGIISLLFLQDLVIGINACVDKFDDEVEVIDYENSST